MFLLLTVNSPNVLIAAVAVLLMIMIPTPRYLPSTTIVQAKKQRRRRRQSVECLGRQSE